LCVAGDRKRSLVCSLETCVEGVGVDFAVWSAAPSALWRHTW